MKNDFLALGFDFLKFCSFQVVNSAEVCQDDFLSVAELLALVDFGRKKWRAQILPLSGLLSRQER